MVGTYNIWTVIVAKHLCRPNDSCTALETLDWVISSANAVSSKDRPFGVFSACVPSELALGEGCTFLMYRIISL